MEDKPQSEKKEGHRRIMQVVEVEEEDKPVQKEPVPSENHEEKSVTFQQSDNTNLQESMPTAKQKEVVSELFQKTDHSLPFPDISVGKRTHTSPLLLWVITVIIIVAAIGGGLLILKTFSLSGKPVSINFRTEPTKSATPTAIQTPTPALSKKDISIQILNGSGTAGVASKMKQLLEGKGYSVAGTGNAKRFDYAATDILYKTGKESYIELIKADISGDYKVGSVSATLDNQNSYDIQIIIGKE